MKLEGVKKFLNISIEVDELTKINQALTSIIKEIFKPDKPDEEPTEEAIALNKLIQEFDKILTNAMDY